MLPSQPPPRSNGPVIAGVGIVVLTVLAGVLFAVSGDDEQSGASATVAGVGAGPGADAGVGVGSPGGGGIGADAVSTSSLPGDTVPPAQAELNDCIAVSYSGDFLGTGSCVDGGAPYVVTEVVDTGIGCSNSEAAWNDDGYHRLCLEVNLVENYCYDFPDPGSTDWLVPALACEEPGTVAVIDIVPGAVDDSGCTTQFEWNRWYAFTAPQMVACVMEF